MLHIDGILKDKVTPSKVKSQFTLPAKELQLNMKNCQKIRKTGHNYFMNMLILYSIKYFIFTHIINYVLVFM